MIKSLDYLRAIAALIVFLSHAFQIYCLPTVGLSSWQYEVNHYLSDTAVLIFFVLSGYVISNSLNRNIQRNGGNLLMMEYLSSRLWRIYPPLIVAILISIVVFSIIVNFELPGYVGTLKAPADIYQAREYLSLTKHDVINALIMNNGLLQMDGPLWSLYIEAKLYLYAGFCALACVLYRRGNWLKLFIISSLMLLSAWFVFNTKTSIYYGLWWICGVVVFLYNTNLVNLRQLALSMLMLFSSMALLEHKLLSLLLQILVVFPLFLLALKIKLPQIRFMGILAGSSYTLYIVHFPMLLLSYSLFSHYLHDYGNASREWMLLLSIIVIFPIALVLGTYIERSTELRLLGTSLLWKVRK